MTPEKWTWRSSFFAFLLFLDLCALTWYFWAIPDRLFERWNKTFSTVAGWLVALLAFFGIKLTLGQDKSPKDILELIPIQLCIASLTIIIWYFVLPFHDLTLALQETDSGQQLSGVQVRVDDEKGARPIISDSNGTITIINLQASAHDLHFQLDGYVEQHITTDFMDPIRSFNRIVPMTKSLGTLELKTTPDGAEVYVDGDRSKTIGRTPKTVFLSARKHTILFAKEGYRPTEWEEVSLPMNTAMILERTLQKVPGPPKRTYNLFIHSDPDGADIYIQNVLKGKTVSTLKLTAGEHRIRIRKNGYEPYQSVVTIPDQSFLSAPLQKRE